MQIYMFFDCLCSMDMSELKTCVCLYLSDCMYMCMYMYMYMYMHMHVQMHMYRYMYMYCAYRDTAQRERERVCVCVCVSVGTCAHAANTCMPACIIHVAWCRPEDHVLVYWSEEPLSTLCRQPSNQVTWCLCLATNPNL